MYYHLCQTLTASGYRRCHGVFYRVADKIFLRHARPFWADQPVLYRQAIPVQHLQHGRLPDPNALGSCRFIYDGRTAGAGAALWVYWRLYETIIPTEDYKRLFNRDLPGFQILDTSGPSAGLFRLRQTSVRS